MRRPPFVAPLPGNLQHPGPWAALLLLALHLPGLAGAAVRPVLLSPGEAKRTAEVATACPTFSWVAAEGAAAHELAVFDLTVPERPELLLHRSLPGAAAAWTPARADALPAERTLAWTVRGLDAAGAPLAAEEGWATPHRFRVPRAPGPEEIAAALDVLRRWQAGGAARVNDAGGPQPAGESPSGEAVEASGTATIRGENPAGSGAQHGVWGQTASATGGGLVAVNLGGGADLVLDGAAQGQADTSLTQSGIDRPSASAQTFDIQNSGAGAMTLRVEGTAVSLAGHVHSGADIVAGLVAEPYVAAAIARDSELMPTVLANDGHGSGLDADTLDGVQGAFFQVRVVGVCPAGQPMRGVNWDGGVICDAVTPAAPVVTQSTASCAGPTSLAIGADGFPVVSFQKDSSTLAVMKCEDRACGGSGEIVSVVDTDLGGVLGWGSSITVPVDGLPVISYGHYSDATGFSLKVAKCDDPACAPGGETITLVDNHTPGMIGDYGNSSIAIGGDGYPVIAYDGSGAKVVKCDDPACSGTGEAIAFVDCGGRPSLAVDSDGYPVISCYDWTEQALKVAKCNDPACAPGGETISTVDDPTNDVGTHSSIALGTDGFPVISYYDATAGALKVARCDDAACAPGGETITAVDDPVNDVGLFTSLAIGSDGFPVISYRDATARNLKVAKCNNRGCTGGSATISTADASDTNVGEHTAIAIGTDGMPVISYRNLSGFPARLRVAKCNNPSCFF